MPQCDDDPDEEFADEYENETDEDPAFEDTEVLDHESAYCPDCGAEVWDSVEVCPKCFAYLGGNTLARPRLDERLRHRWIALVAIVLVIIIILTWVLWLI